MTAAVARLTDPDDPRLRVYRDVRDRDLARTDTFMAEGDVVVRVLAAGARFAPRSLLLSERRLVALGDVVEALPAGVPVLVVPQALMEAVVGFRIHRGVLAAGVRGPLPEATALLAGLARGAGPVVVLDGLTNADNVGGVFRNAAAFGAGAILLDATCCDPLYRKAIRVSAGATLTVPWTRAGGAASLLGLLRAQGWRVLALTPAADAVPLPEVRPGPRDALVLGTEGPGLGEAAQAAADLRVRIPMADGFDSLNVATASGVALYGLRQSLASTTTR